MHVSTLVRWGAALTVLGFAVSACSDSPSGPSAQPKRFSSDAAQEAWLLANGGPDRAGRGKADKTLEKFSREFVVDPSEFTTIKAGDHEVRFPAFSICDPSTSGYGEDMWDAPCEPLRTPLTITATWSSKYGHAHIDFQPALRFVPTNDPNQFVRLYMKDYEDLADGEVPSILWQRPSDSKWVDESQADPSMTSFRDESGHRVSRRLKHFSGYLMQGFESCDAWSSLSCLPLSEFAGYLLSGQ